MIVVSKLNKPRKLKQVIHKDLRGSLTEIFLRQKIKHCDIIQDISGDDMCYLLDPNTKDVVKVKESKLMLELREREYYTKKSTKRKELKAKARLRRKNNQDI